MSAKLRIRTEGKVDSYHLDIEEHYTVETFVQHLLIIGVFQGCQPEEILIFEEDAEEELLRDYPIGRSHHQKHFHAHRCKHIKATVSFNGAPHYHEFRPGVRLRKVVEWAKAKFGIEAQQQCALRIGSDKTEPLGLDDHLGSFAHYGECSVKFYLTILKGQQG